MSEQKSLLERLEAAKSSLSEGKFGAAKKAASAAANKVNKAAKNITKKINGNKQVQKLIGKPNTKQRAAAKAAVGGAVVGSAIRGKLDRIALAKRNKNESLREKFNALKNHSLFEHEGNDAPEKEASVTGGIAFNHNDKDCPDEKCESLSSTLKAKFQALVEKKEKKGPGLIGSTVKGAASGAVGLGTANAVRANLQAHKAFGKQKARANKLVQSSKASSSALNKGAKVHKALGNYSTAQNYKRASYNAAEQGIKAAAKAKKFGNAQKAITSGSFRGKLLKGAKLGAAAGVGYWGANKAYNALKNRKTK